MTSFYHAAGRGGLGAVMGSKNLKAIYVAGYGDIEVYDPEKIFEILSKAFERVKVREKAQAYFH